MRGCLYVSGKPPSSIIFTWRLVGHNLNYIVTLSHYAVQYRAGGCLSPTGAHLNQSIIPQPPIHPSCMWPGVWVCANPKSQMGNSSFGLHIDDVMAKYNFLLQRIPIFLWNVRTTPAPLSSPPQCQSNGSGRPKKGKGTRHGTVAERSNKQSSSE